MRGWSRLIAVVLGAAGLWGQVFAADTGPAVLRGSVPAGLGMLAPRPGFDHNYDVDFDRDYDHAGFDRKYDTTGIDRSYDRHYDTSGFDRRFDRP